MNEKNVERFVRWQRKLDKKIQSQPQPVQILQRRSLSTPKSW